MRDSKELIRALRPFAIEDSRRSWRHLLTTLVVLLGALLTAATRISLWLAIPASVVLGLTLVRLFIIYHDYQHRAIFRESRVAAWILWVFGLLILTPPKVWNRLHNYHHAQNSQIATSGIGSFPVMTTLEYASASPKVRRWYRLYRSPFIICFGYVAIFIVGICLRYLIKEPRRHLDSLLALTLHVAALVGIGGLGGASLLCLTYLGPLVIALTLGAYLFYAQHNYPSIRLQSREEWDFVDAALHSSSFMDGSRLMHWFTGNIGYHHVHHLNSRIPFYRLPEAMAALPELQHPGKTSLRPRDVRACLRLKLWDPESQRMVGFDGA